ncbi:hypothetical protein ACFVXW_38750 [Streptomyces sp. NPDC058251]|uniref:hypothetical protein n=1 Tax=unclassified Streptomyces TaxID=2593676 RepID=UPI0036EE0384
MPGGAKEFTVQACAKYGKPRTVYVPVVAVESADLFCLLERPDIVRRAGNGVTYHLQAVELAPDTTETFPNGVITVSFDDSYEHFAYPGGQFGNTTDCVPVDKIAARYFTSARSISSETVESFAAAMPHRLKAATGINDGTSIGGASSKRTPSAASSLSASTSRCPPASDRCGPTCLRRGRSPSGHGTDSRVDRAPRGRASTTGP